MADPAAVPLPGIWPADGDELGVYVRRFARPASEADAVPDPDTGPVSGDGESAGGGGRKVLAGLPIAVKDLIWTEEGPPQGARPGYAGDATVVARLRRAGAVITGKTTMTELALSTPEPRDGAVIPRNPWHTGHWAGGSSSGSAIAVAVGAAWGALGTDTAGSIRVPAAYCGITGLLPSYGRVPVTGVLPLAFSIDRVGPLARTAHGCAQLLGVIAGHDPADPTSAREPVPDYLAALTGRLDGLRIGVWPGSGARVRSPGQTTGSAETAGNPDVQEDPALGPVFAAAAEVLHSLGARLTGVTLPYYAELTWASAVIMLSEALSYHLPDLRAGWARFGRSARTMLASAVLYSAADYVQAQRVRRSGRRALAALLSDVDVVITPTALRGAPTVEEAVSGGGPAVWGDYGPICTPYWSVAGCPAVSVPMGITGDGLPLGLQLAGRPFDEATVLRTAHAFQEATGWHERRPPTAAMLPPRHPARG
jgi:aspartyl-tRNA(Asn)/glutamyl-tRNA(Gln) amidotransferase subunit A